MKLGVQNVPNRISYICLFHVMKRFFEVICLLLTCLLAYLISYLRI
jgi:hypothetical protein